MEYYTRHPVEKPKSGRKPTIHQFHLQSIGRVKNTDDTTCTISTKLSRHNDGTTMSIHSTDQNACSNYPIIVSIALYNEIHEIGTTFRNEVGALKIANVDGT